MFDYSMKAFSARPSQAAAAAARRATQAIAGGMIAFSAFLGSVAIAAAEDRSLKLFFTHTGERATITYKRDGRIDPKGLAQVNRFLRDWRKNETAKMDPRLLDLVWEVYDRSGATGYIHIVSAYRSPATNNMLRGRSRSSGVAKSSQHTLGKAIDFFIPGVKLAKLRSLAMQMQVGGVGYYPSSGSPFVHLDVGNVRAWPRMSRKELAGIFPEGKTMHLPSNGKPLPGYQQAVADYKRRVGPKSIEIASTAKGKGSSRPGSGLLTAMLPTPKSRAQEALDLQTDARAKSQDGSGPAFVDLASLAVPVPGLRPASLAEAPVIQMASLGPAMTRAAVVLGGLPTEDLSLPAGVAASLEFFRSESDPEEEFDAQEALVSWALSAPGTASGLRAPRFRLNSSSNVAAGQPDRSSTQTEITDEFNAGRF
jgi:uncharacterized protein YcbK (DUF882 family)